MLLDFIPRHRERAGMTQIATKYVPQELQRYAKRSGMAQIVTKNAARPYPQTYRQGGNDAKSDKICSSNLRKIRKDGGYTYILPPDLRIPRKNAYILLPDLRIPQQKCMNAATRLADTT